jgi:hypothetical protein
MPESGSRFDGQVKFFQLLQGDRGGGSGHEVHSAGCLGESDHFPQGRFSGQQHCHAIQAEGNSAVRRSAVTKGIQKKAKT